MTSTARHRIKNVVDMTGIPRNTLIAWERRYRLPSPERLPNGYRLYSDDDVAMLRHIKEAIARGVSVSQAVAGIRAIEPSTVNTRGEAASMTLVQQSGAMFAALMRFDRASASHVVEMVRHLAYATAIDEIYLPLLRRVGDAWSTGTISVAQEHFTSAFVREQFVAMLLNVGTGPANGLRVACVTLPCERHELGLMALSVHLVLRGCQVTYLGADLPEPDLAAYLQEQRPDCLCISVIVKIPSTELTRAARAIRKVAPTTTRIVIGGVGLPPEPRVRVAGVELIDDWCDLDLM